MSKVVGGLWKTASMPPFETADPAWRSCFEQAWESFQAGSGAVGAVVVDPRGVEVSAGRGRKNETSAPPGQIAGSYIAHAEINALATLPPGDNSGHTLYTTLEPCFLCTAASRHSHIGTIRYAAADPVWRGIDRMPELNEVFARRWSRRTGPLDGPLQTWGALLPLIAAVERGGTLDGYAEAMPEPLALARRWAGRTGLREMDLDTAMRTVLLANERVDQAAG